MNPAPEPTALEHLHSRLAGLTETLAVLTAASAKLRATAFVEASVIEEIGELGRAEIAKTTEWAKAGCVGDQPVPDQQRRRELAEKLASAQAATANASGSLYDLDHQARQLNEEIAAVNLSIEKAALDLLQIEFGELREQYATAMAQGSKLAAKLHGMCSFLSNEGRRLTDRGDREASRKYFARAGAMTAIRLPLPDVSQHEIFAAAEHWARRAATLRKGARA